MAYLNEEELRQLGLKHIGENVKISSKASIYNPDQIEISDHSRVDDFCVISGKIKIGKFVHITPMCLLAGGEKGIVMDDYCTVAYGVKIFSQSDDYSGSSMTNSTIPQKYKNETKKPVYLERHSIIGAGSIVMSGVTISEGTSVGAMSLIMKSTSAWSIYVGNPAVKLKDRRKDLLKMEKEFIEGYCK